MRRYGAAYQPGPEPPSYHHIMYHIIHPPSDKHSTDPNPIQLLRQPPITSPNTLMCVPCTSHALDDVPGIRVVGSVWGYEDSGGSSVG